MKVSAVFCLAVLGGCISEASAYNPWGSSRDSSSKLENQQTPPFKFDYKLSFKRPFYYNNSIPHWQESGDVLKAKDLIRLAPSVPGSKGQIWSSIPNPHKNWEVIMQLKISGQHIGGGRGMAFWYTNDPNKDGPIYGSKDNWRGLGVWLDSATPQTHSPMTIALMNDGTKNFAEKNDPRKHMLGSCNINYRNTQEPVFVKITYKENTLSVMMDPKNRGASYQSCLREQNVQLPTGYYFGLSAASQNPADDHDVIAFETFELNPAAKTSHPDRPMEQEKKRQGQAFTGLTEEQKKKIEDVQYQIKYLEELANKETVTNENFNSLGAVMDQQLRLTEMVELIQLQLEAMGAPTKEQIVAGDFKPVFNQKANDAGRNTEAAGSSGSYNVVIDEINKRGRDQDTQISHVLNAITKLEKCVRAMEHIQGDQTKKLDAVTGGDKSQAKGSSTILNIIAYFFIAQIFVFVAAYGYYKLRIHRNEKKFI
ncbi:hypothetical protein NQZ79_g7940 [Umbelopsis isabellina]|nr:hypothetical protein NQZ79_g7940 [Umbelopsis isabellina]